MKLSEELYDRLLSVNNQTVYVTPELIRQICTLEQENSNLKARLRGIGQRAEDLQQAVMDMESVLQKFSTGG
jgi:hypothetical protein